MGAAEAGAMKAIHKRRLLKAADIVEKVQRGKFDMHLFYNECGSPSCVLGHYQAVTKKITRRQVYDFDVAEHFGLKGWEDVDLFGSEGCGGAKTGKQAAKYIRQFVKRKEKEE